MIDHLRNFNQARFDMISGPVKSGKSNKLITLIRTFIMDKKKLNNDLLVVKHPEDDKNSRGRISSFKKTSIDAIEYKSADEIANEITDETKFVVISGIHLYDKNIVSLCDSLRESGRIIIAGGINLKSDGTPYGSMDQLLAKADNYEIMSAICNYKNCNKNAYRTQRIIKNNKEIFEPRCLVDYEFEGRPDYKPHLIDQEPSLETIVGPMFSGKTDLLHTRYYQITNKDGIAIFKWMGDSRYSTNKVVSHDKDDIPSIDITNTDDIRNYMEKNKQINLIMIDEVQFIKGSYELVKELLYKGYKIILTGLKRDFRGEPFGYPNSEISKILTLATEITNMYASCYRCEHPATESQRLIRKNGIIQPASFDDKIVVVGGKDLYKAVCRLHHEIKGAPPNRYSGRFNKIKI
ncbi:MAG: AAA family ATPase [Nanoarchaeota archaeon]|nr:AAA family ATPase [Nanoarchaeota archaeon]